MNNKQKNPMKEYCCNVAQAENQKTSLNFIHYDGWWGYTNFSNHFVKSYTARYQAKQMPFLYGSLQATKSSFYWETFRHDTSLEIY